jgi:hypothetical protein
MMIQEREYGRLLAVMKCGQTFEVSRVPNGRCSRAWELVECGRRVEVKVLR